MAYADDVTTLDEDKNNMNGDTTMLEVSKEVTTEKQSAWLCPVTKCRTKS